MRSKLFAGGLKIFTAKCHNSPLFIYHAATICVRKLFASPSSRQVRCNCDVLSVFTAGAVTVLLPAALAKMCARKPEESHPKLIKRAPRPLCGRSVFGKYRRCPISAQTLKLFCVCSRGDGKSVAHTCKIGFEQ
jgi:hypothetical protein